MIDLRPTKPFVRVQFERSNGEQYTVDLTWRVEPINQFHDRLVTMQNSGPDFGVYTFEERNALWGEQTSFMNMSKPKPFFINPKTIQEYGFIQVTADAEHRQRYDLKENEKPDIHAYLYRFNSKTILLVRNFKYSHQDFSNDVYMKGYQAILDQWEDLADVLVIDQTHNGGGNYCQQFGQLFITEEKPALVQRCNADRKWIHNYRSRWFMDVALGNEIRQRFSVFADLIEQAYDRGERLSPAIPNFAGADHASPNKKYQWKKPMLVLIDELAGSCGDAFPAFIQANGVAKLFGRQTKGLGGNVEPGPVLPHSQTNFRFTRGLFSVYREDGAYSDEWMVENNGVLPDYEYEHTVDDVRAEFIDYVKAFSQTAIEQIQPSVALSE